MALINCPECGKDISSRSVICPGCGHPHKGAFYCFEYRTQAKLFGLPLVHVVLGPALDPSTGKVRMAKGIIAIGGIAMGLISLGGVSIGLISLGGLAIGLAAAGGLAIAAGVAVGGAAIGYIAIGGGALGYYVLGGGCCGVENLGGANQLLGSLSRRMFPIANCLLRVFGH